MGKLTQKWGKVFGVSNKGPRQLLIENDSMNEDDFGFKHLENSVFIHDDNKTGHVYENQRENYDNLHHGKGKLNPKIKKTKESKGGLSDNTNVRNNSSKSFAQNLKRVFASRPNNKENKENIQQIQQNSDDAKYSELYDENLTEKPTVISKKTKPEKTKEIKSPINFNYYEIPDLLGDDSMGKSPNPKTPRIEYQNKNFFESKNNLFDTEQCENQQIEKKVEEIENKPKDLTLTINLTSFNSQTEACNWFLNSLGDTMNNFISNDPNIEFDQKTERFNLVKAHLIYARNFYDLKIKNSIELQSSLINTHPCLITLACLFDSDTVRIVDAHACPCDNYIYLFQTRLKFCAWKVKIFIILKKPKFSSMDRLTLIEDLKNCHKMIANS